MSSGTTFRFEAIGTRWQIDLAETLSAVDQATILSDIQKRIAVFDRDYSRFRADSLVTKMSRQAGYYTLPTDAEPLFDLYKRLYDLTDGAFTPLIGQTMVEAGYDAEYSLLPKTLHTPPAWDEALEYRYPKLEIKKPALLDIGAAGKGYIIDIVAELLSKKSIQSFCVDAGGDIFYQNVNRQALRVGLENPMDFKQAIGVANILNQSICGSAGNRRRWGKFHHIIDPRTLESPQNILAVWVVASTTIVADALATCLFLSPPATFVADFVFEYAIVYADFSLEKSVHFPAEFFLK